VVKNQGTIPVGALLIVVILVLLKAHYISGTPLHGGLPSGRCRRRIFNRSFNVSVRREFPDRNDGAAAYAGQSEPPVDEKIHTPRSVPAHFSAIRSYLLLAYLFQPNRLKTIRVAIGGSQRHLRCNLCFFRHFRLAFAASKTFFNNSLN